MMEILLSFGADLDLKNNDGLRAQDVAQASPHADPKSIELLTPVASLGGLAVPFVSDSFLTLSNIGYSDDDDMNPFADDGEEEEAEDSE